MTNLVELRNFRRIIPHFLFHVVVVNVVADSDELFTEIRTNDEDDSYSKRILDRDFVGVWGICLEGINLIYIQNNSQIINHSLSRFRSD